MPVLSTQTVLDSYLWEDLASQRGNEGLTLFSVEALNSLLNMWLFNDTLHVLTSLAFSAYGMAASLSYVLPLSNMIGLGVLGGGVGVVGLGSLCGSVGPSWELELAWAAGWGLEPALLNFAAAVSTSQWLALFESLDPVLVVAEICALVTLLALFEAVAFSLPKVSLSRKLASVCQRISFSVTEVTALSSFVVFFVLFDLFAAFSEDDAAETFGFFFILFVLVVAALSALFVNVHYYYMLSCVGSSDVTLRVVYSDLVSNGLCLLRVVFCWVRYVFYDLQSELIDFTTHYTDPDLSYAWAEAGTGATRTLGSFEQLVTGALLFLLDIQLCILQLFISCFKLAIATFLFWLILDLFLLRPLAQVEALNLLRAQQKRQAYSHVP